MYRWIALVLLVLISGSAFAQDTEAKPVIHKVVYGDTLFTISQRYGKTVNEIAQANSIIYTWNIQVGQELIIPGLEAPDAREEIENPLVAAAPIQHVIQRGETLAGIANRYGVTTDLILLANNIANPNLILFGQTLNIWTPETVDNGSNAADAAAIATAQPETPASEPVVELIPLIHQVRNGETLGTIARTYGVTLNELIAANNISNPNHILLGAPLVIPGRSTENVSGTDPTNLESYQSVRPTITQGKEIVVDLSDQRVYAFENGELVFSVLVSTGLPATPTVQGDYKIYLRHDSQTMSGPGYYLPGVQWVQYFYQGYGFHGTYWHENYGQPMSHGCVNMTNADAYWLYRWATIGTAVHVRM